MSYFDRGSPQPHDSHEVDALALSNVAASRHATALRVRYTGVPTDVSVPSPWDGVECTQAARAVVIWQVWQCLSPVGGKANLSTCRRMPIIRHTVSQ